MKVLVHNIFEWVAVNLSVIEVFKARQFHGTETPQNFIQMVPGSFSVYVPANVTEDFRSSASLPE